MTVNIVTKEDIRMCQFHIKSVLIFIFYTIII